MANGFPTGSRDLPARIDKILSRQPSNDIGPITKLPKPVTPPPSRPTRPQPATAVLPAKPAPIGQDRPPPMTGLPTPVTPPPSRPVRPKPVTYTRPDVTPAPGSINDMGNTTSQASGSGGNYTSNASPNVSRRRGMTEYSNPVHPSSSRRRGY